MNPEIAQQGLVGPPMKAKLSRVMVALGKRRHDRASRWSVTPRLLVRSERLPRPGRRV